MINATSAAETKSQHGKCAQRIGICTVMSKTEIVSTYLQIIGKNGDSVITLCRTDFFQWDFVSFTNYLDKDLSVSSVLFFQAK